MPKTSRTYGHIPGVPVGAEFRTRKELLEASVHGHIWAGIHGDSSPYAGAFSICVSGGYEDDEDLGDKIIYVGSGGQGAEKQKQISDQSLDGFGNKSLRVSSKTKNPVRVVRGACQTSRYAPSSGYRYDGLYVVDSAVQKKGKAGHEMWFFELNKITEEATSTEPLHSEKNAEDAE